MVSPVKVVFITTPGGEVAENLARALVTEQIVACVNRIRNVQSCYMWEGELCDEPEELLIIKTIEDNLDRLKARVTELHPYDMPELLVLPVEDGFPGYLQWVQDTCRQTRE